MEIQQQQQQQKIWEAESRYGAGHFTHHLTSMWVNVYITSPGPKSNVIPSPVVNYAYVKFENGRAKTLLCIARPLGIPLTEVIKMNLTFDQNLKGFSIRDQYGYMKC